MELALGSKRTVYKLASHNAMVLKMDKALNYSRWISMDTVLSTQAPERLVHSDAMGKTTGSKRTVHILVSPFTMVRKADKVHI